MIEIEKEKCPLRTIGIEYFPDALPPFLTISLYNYTIYIGRKLNMWGSVDSKNRKK